MVKGDELLRGRVRTGADDKIRTPYLIYRLLRVPFNQPFLLLQDANHLGNALVIGAQSDE